MAKSKANSLDTLVELQADRADLERREREARNRACQEIGAQVLDSGLPLADLAELETLLARVKKLTMREALMRLSQRARPEPEDAPTAASSDDVGSKTRERELADAAV